MNVKITSPIEGYDGRTVFGPLSVEFKGGVATTDEVSAPLRSYLQTKGYTLTDEDAVPVPPYPQGEVTEKWSGKELDAYAAERGIDLTGATKKADKVARIGEAAAATVPTGSTGEAVAVTEGQPATPETAEAEAEAAASDDGTSSETPEV
ncbi:hypothetical protein [Cellulomonas sp. RIT-PI-Y]|uniref:hypothetical protein n=1 Tax=Cellulomonas sp. RIT-PI-Y TaxID=3035297 RepID=UPI0021DB72FA|nr:hypothetical protein [Cellulomonas sp. RIT-PI-Y]